MINGKHLRFTLAGALSALAVAVPAAQAARTADTGVHVCNQATHTSSGGAYDATDGDTGPAARYQDGLKAKPGGGAGLATAAAHSPALTLCSAEEPPAGGGYDS